MCRASRIWRQLLPSQRKGRVESRSWLLPTDRLRRRRFAFGQEWWAEVSVTRTSLR